LLVLFKSVDRKIIKLADFGESKPVSVGLSTYCGTPDYMAPELVRGDSYGLEVDLWAVGVITFVMLGGYIPFSGETEMEIFSAILGLRYHFQSPYWDHVGPDGRDFIDGLLKENPMERLTTRQALSHGFITKFTPEFLRVIPAPPREEKVEEKINNSNNNQNNNSSLGNSKQKDALKDIHKTKGKSISSPSILIPTINRIKPSIPHYTTTTTTTTTTSSTQISQSNSSSSLSGAANDKLDLSKNPKNTVLDRITALSKTTDRYEGEFEYMKAVVASTGTGTSKGDVNILEATWERLNTIQAKISGSSGSPSGPGTPGKNTARKGK